MDVGLKVAVCSTSNERAVSKIVDVLLGPQVAKAMRVFAGDIVPKKKPDPAIYLLAAKELGVDPDRSGLHGRTTILVVELRRGFCHRSPAIYVLR